jgi:hypothetical protein
MKRVPAVCKAKKLLGQKKQNVAGLSGLDVSVWTTARAVQHPHLSH